MPEICGDEMSVGMTKSIGSTVSRKIGGFVRQVMWDGIDCHAPRMLSAGIAESVDLEPARFVHLRPQAPATKASGPDGCAPASAVFHGHLAALLPRGGDLPPDAHPALIASIAMLWGYFRSWLKGLPRYDDPEFRRFLRSTSAPACGRESAPPPSASKMNGRTSGMSITPGTTKRRPGANSTPSCRPAIRHRDH